MAPGGSGIYSRREDLNSAAIDSDITTFPIVARIDRATTWPAFLETPNRASIARRCSPGPRKMGHEIARFNNAKKKKNADGTNA